MSAVDSPLFTVSPAHENEVLERTAQILAEQMQTALGGIDNLFVMPMRVVTVMTTLSRETVPKKMAVTKMGGKDGVTLGEIRRYLAENTVPVQIHVTKRKRRASA
jgi:hypothetical protein